jgi:hypothetical protein
MTLKSLLTGWHFMRFLRLFLSLMIGMQAFQAHDYFLGLLALVLLFQVATNVGCCGPAGCVTPTNNKNEGNIEDITFEEVTTKK